MYAHKLQPVQNPGTSTEPRDLVSVRTAARRPSADSAAPASLLVVDGDSHARAIVAEMLLRLGYEVTCAGSAREALAWLQKRHFDGMLCELLVAGQNGSGLLFEATEQYPEMTVIVIASPETAQSAGEAVRRAASDYIIRPCNESELAIIVQRGLTRRALQQKHAQRYRLGLETSNESVLDALLSALNTRETEVQGHSERVTAYTMELADQMAIPPGQLYHIERGALLHDIGKIGISDRILQKPGSLTAEEWAEVRKHPLIGYQMCVDIDMLRPASQSVRHHHERWDGAGYPDRLSGEAIPMGARIFAVADTLDGITSDRPYRAARPFAVAREEIVKNSRKQFDPGVVQAFLSVPEGRWMYIRAHVGG